jgi:hypothetical protein
MVLTHQHITKDAHRVRRVNRGITWDPPSRIIFKKLVNKNVKKNVPFGLLARCPGSNPGTVYWIDVSNNASF